MGQRRDHPHPVREQRGSERLVLAARALAGQYSLRLMKLAAFNQRRNPDVRGHDREPD
jgi:DNA/RNA endonuclease YhcR with UshA esterase domain